MEVSCLHEPHELVGVASDLESCNENLSGLEGKQNKSESKQENILHQAVVNLYQEALGDSNSYASLLNLCSSTLRDAAIIQSGKSWFNQHSGSNSPSSCPEVSISQLGQISQLPKEIVQTIAVKEPRRRFHRKGVKTLKASRPGNYADDSPITDLNIIFTGDSVPDKFTKVDRTPGGLRADLNKGARGHFVYLCASKDVTANKLPISELLIIYPDREEFIPAGYEVVQRRGAPANLNTGTQGERVHLCFRRSETSFITDVVVFFPRKGEQLPYGYMMVDRTPFGHLVDLNMNSGGTEICLCYKTKLNFITDIQRYWQTKLLLDDQKAFGSQKYGLNSINLINSGQPHDGDEKDGAKRQFEQFSSFGSSIALLSTSLPDKVSDLRIPSSFRLSIDDQSKDSEHDDIHTLSSNSIDESMCETLQPNITRLPVVNTIDLYIYPLLIACFTRHGTISETAMHIISDCIDQGICSTRDLNSQSNYPNTPLLPESNLLVYIVQAVTSYTFQGIMSRFPKAIACIRKIIKICPDGFDSSILHSILKALSYIGEYDVNLVKSLEDELMYNILRRYESECAQEPSKFSLLHMDIPHSLHGAHMNQHITIRNIVHNIIENAIIGVNVAKATENILGIVKSYPSIHSPHFIPDVIKTMQYNEFTHSQVSENFYQVIVTLCKLISRRSVALSMPNSSELLKSHIVMDREQYSILNALRCLNFVLLSAGPKTKTNRKFCHVIRRFVASTAISITLIPHTSIFRGVLTIISTLWKHYRRHLKVELALIMEHIFVRILRHNVTAMIVLDHQTCILEEIVPWFQTPGNVMEIFLNFDMDRVQQWKIFEHLFAAVCNIAEGGNQINKSLKIPQQPLSAHHNLAHSSAEFLTLSSAVQVQVQSLHTVLTIARSVMDASGHAYLINRDTRTRNLSMDNGGWEEDEFMNLKPLILKSGVSNNSIKINMAHPASSQENASTQKLSTSEHEGEDTNSGTNSSSRIRSQSKISGAVTVRLRNEIHKRNRQFLKRAMEISNSKSLKKAIEYLIAMNFVKETVRDITSFLRIYHDFFDEAQIGDYLGEGDEDFKDQIRRTYIRAISFKGMSLVESLRHFLTNGGFRLPGEAQKIERMVEAFAQCYWEDTSPAFSSADTAMILAYSIIMLNTDLHNPQVKKDKMTREQFVRNNRGIDNGKDLPRSVLVDIYDDIARHPMHLNGKSHRYSTQIADIASSGSTLHSVLEAQDHETKFLMALEKSVAQAEELMKDLSLSNPSFQFVGVDMSLSTDIIKILFEGVWFYFLALCTSILCDNPNADSTMTIACLDLLRFSISTCLFLDMSVERRAFCNLLVKVQLQLQQYTINVQSTDRITSKDTEYEVSSDWVDAIDAAATEDDPWRVIGDIHLLVNRLKDQVSIVQRSQELSSVMQRINRSDIYLKNSTQFLKEGDLVKKCRSRCRSYRFFLFNDQLLYAEKTLSGQWNAHNSLRLKLTRIVDIPEGFAHSGIHFTAISGSTANSGNRHGFQLLNPAKSFVVYAENAVVKASWMQAIQDAITQTTHNKKLKSQLMTESLDNSSNMEFNAVVLVGDTSETIRNNEDISICNSSRKSLLLEHRISEDYEDIGEDTY